MNYMRAARTNVLYGSLLYSSSMSNCKKSSYCATSFLSSAILDSSFVLPITNLKTKPVASSNLQVHLSRFSKVRIHETHRDQAAQLQINIMNKGITLSSFVKSLIPSA